MEVVEIRVNLGLAVHGRSISPANVLKLILLLPILRFMYTYSNLDPNWHFNVELLEQLRTMNIGDLETE